MEGDKIKTLDDLAALMIRTMASKEDIVRLETRVGGLEGQVGSLETKIGGLDSKMVNIEARLESIEGDVKEIKENMLYRDEFDDAKHRIKYV